jgi:serine/threonine protein kinase
MAATELASGAGFGEDGRYRLEALLGTGGMASVWLATDGRLGRPVAIKFLADVLALDDDYVRRFEREGRVAASLSHPNLVSVFDLSSDGSRPYMVMEYVSGGTLAQRLHDTGAGLPDPEVLFGELLDALAYIHAAGVIHRDIKPANLLIGADGRARLTDFGIAQPSAASSVTRAGLVLGTARYIAPEVLRGHRSDERSDLYACGVLLRQCLEHGGPRHLYALAERLTAEDPSRRPAPASAVRAMLPRSARSTRAASARRSSEPETRAFRSRPRLAPTLIASPRLAPTRLAPPRLAPPRFAPPRFAPPRLEPRRPAPRRRTRAAAMTVIVIAVVLVIVAVTSGSGGGTKAPARLPAPPAPSASLARQLNYLDTVIGHSSR